MGVSVIVNVWVCWGSPMWLPNIRACIANPWIYPWEATQKKAHDFSGICRGIFAPTFR